MAVGYRFPLFCALIVLSAAGISAAQTAPAPAVDCSSLIANMVDCLSYVTAGGTAKKPEGTCCSGLKTVLKTDADCLCETFKNSAQLGVTLNVTKALTLPAACHLSAPSIANCALTTGTAPAQSPLALSPSSPVGAPTPGFGVNEGAPAPTPGSPGSPPATVSVVMFVFTIMGALLFA